MVDVAPSDVSLKTCCTCTLDITGLRQDILSQYRFTTFDRAKISWRITQEAKREKTGTLAHHMRILRGLRPPGPGARESVIKGPFSKLSPHTKRSQYPIQADSQAVPIERIELDVSALTELSSICRNYKL